MSDMPMLERLARAVMAARTVEGQPYNGTRGVIAEAEDNPHCEMALRQAKAMLSEMLQPSPEMEAAFYAVCDERGNVLWKHGYRAMIDAARREGK